MGVEINADGSSTSIEEESTRPTMELHRNGQSEPWHLLSQPLPSQYLKQFEDEDKIYEFQAQATSFLAQFLPDVFDYCDEGPERTVVQHDHHLLVPTKAAGTLPCRFYTREGKHLTTWHALARHLPRIYLVPAGRMFFFGPSHIGDEFVLDHVNNGMEQPIVLQTLSLSPAVFDVTNFFSQAESDAIVQKAIGETSASHGFHRSTTGTTGASVYSKRTSENAWDTHGPTAVMLKRRGFELLGMPWYKEELSDGLQVLRYNKTTAYVPHMDYLEDKSGRESYDYDTSGKGGNRFATLLLYFTEPKAGGETVFVKAWPVHGSQVPLDQALQELRASGDADFLEKGSWQEEMVAQCRSRLAVKPKATRTVLFYNQLPDGTPDRNSVHGGCPVLGGTKLAANLWTWSAIRPEYPGGPQKREPREDEKPREPIQIQAKFQNGGTNPKLDADTELWFEDDTLFGKLGPDDPPIHVNTFKTHVWKLKVRGETVRTIVIDIERDKQTFTV